MNECGSGHGHEIGADTGLVQGPRSTAADVEAMSYVEFMATLNETNRPPGGLASVLEVRSLCNIRPHHHVLDIGCNTGFVAFALCEHADCLVTGIDISSQMIAVARARAARLDLQPCPTFSEQDATALPFASGSFDLSICGGSLPFMDSPKLAVAEMARVVRGSGFVVSLDFYYSSPPPADLLERLGAALGVPIRAWPESYWQELFEMDLLEPVAALQRDVSPVPPARIQRYVRSMIERAGERFNDDGRAAARARLQGLCDLFNENHGYLAARITICQKVSGDSEPILFCC